MALEFSWVYDDSELSEVSESEISSDQDTDPEPEPAPPVVRSTPKVNEVRPTKTTRPSTQQATKQSRNRIAAKSSPYLESPRTTTYSLSSLHEWMKLGTINLDPEYQRAVVWTTQKQESLIDSFYHNFYVPPIIFATTREKDGTVIRTCIDGKQRLTSMRLFMDGKLSHKDSVTGRRSWFSNPKGAKRRLIAPNWQTNFRSTQIACVEYDGITEEQQREIFQRVQMGVTLTPADRLQSVNGPIADLIREVRVRINSTEGFEGYLDWGKTRGKDFKALAEIAYLITHAKTTKPEPTVQRLEAFLDNKAHPVPVAKRYQEFLAILQPAFPNVMDIFCRIVQHPELGKPLRENLSPLEFVISAYLVFCYRKRLSDTQLSHAIAQMRRDIKRSFRDMKFDTAKCKHLLNFIHKTMPSLIPSLNSDGYGDVPAYQVPCQRIERNFENLFKDAKVEDKSATKRKRKEQDGEDAVSDSDDEPLWAKKHKVKRRRSSSGPDVDSREKAIDTEPPPKPRASMSRLSLSTSRSSAPASKARITVKRTPVEQQSACSQISDVTQGRSMPTNKSVALQVATPRVKPPPSTRVGLGTSQQVFSKLGANFFEPVPLGKRAGTTRTANLNQPPPTAPLSPATQFQTQPVLPPSISRRGPQRSSSSSSPVVEQSSLSPSISPGTIRSASGSVLPPYATISSRMTGSTSSHSARMRTGPKSPDRLAPLRSAKAKASMSVVGSTPDPSFSQDSRLDSVNLDESRPSPTVPVSSAETRPTGNDADIRWQNGFAGLLPTDIRTKETIIKSFAMAPLRSIPTPSPSPIAPSGWSRSSK